MVSKMEELLLLLYRTSATAVNGNLSATLHLAFLPVHWFFRGAENWEVEYALN